LSQEGILLSRRNYGVFVVEVETHDLREINEARESFESAAARRMLDAAPGRSKTPAKC
jgi:DNA-binding GntR family transcriptional regulator